jgi:hypothetical protein
MPETHILQIAGHKTVVETPTEDAFAAETVDAACEIRGYQSEIPNPAYDPADPDSPETIPNPQSREMFRDMDVLTYLRLMVVEYRKRNRDITPNDMAAKNEADLAKIDVISSGPVSVDLTATT